MTFTRTVTVAAGVFAPGHLGELTWQVPFELADAVLEETRRRERRLRLLPSRVGIYFVLALGLFPALGYQNVWVRVANGTLGWPDEAPFDRILVAAGGPSVPPPLFEQLAEGGRMVMPIGDATSQVLHVIEKRRGEMRTSEHSGCVFVKLLGKYAWES